MMSAASNASLLRMATKRHSVNFFPQHGLHLYQRQDTAKLNDVPVHAAYQDGVCHNLKLLFLDCFADYDGDSTEPFGFSHLGNYPGSAR